MLFLYLLVSLSLFSQRFHCGIQFKSVSSSSDDSVEVTERRFLVAAHIKDHSYALPTFLATLEELNCGENANTNTNKKKKCDLWVVFDQCSDSSYEMLTEWLSGTRELFETILMLDTNNDLATREKHPELDEFYFSSNLKFRALK